MNDELVVYMSRSYNALKLCYNNFENFKKFIKDNCFNLVPPHEICPDTMIEFNDIDGIKQSVLVGRWLVVADKDPTEYYILNQEEYNKMFHINGMSI